LARSRLRLSAATSICTEGAASAAREYHRRVGLAEAPRVTLWLNDTLIWNVQQARNDLLGDATDGMIALQLHWNAWSALDPPTKATAYPAVMWKPGAVHRYRNIAIKELK